MVENNQNLDDADDLLTVVCVKCGKEYYFEDEEPPEGLTCEKCGGKVFRSFDTVSGDEAVEDFEETTGRDMDTDDSGTDTLPGDVLDLNRD